MTEGCKHWMQKRQVVMGGSRCFSAKRLHHHHGARIAKGKVIIGVSGGDRPTRGFFDAL